MPMIRGTDDAGATHWLQQSGYWGAREHAYNFTPAAANVAAREKRNLNCNLPAQDRIMPEIVTS